MKVGKLEDNETTTNPDGQSRPPHTGRPAWFVQPPGVRRKGITGPFFLLLSIFAPRPTNLWNTAINT